VAAPTFDLQCHSTYSDGELPPAEVVARAAAAEVELLALSDHDTVDGVAEAQAAAADHGIRLVPAVEVSAVHDVHEDLHLLGYGIDHTDARLAELLADFRADRARRIYAMAERMREFGFAVDEAPLAARREAGDPLGRPHLAAAVLNHPDNAERLKAEGISGANDLFPAYLVPGARAYVARSHPTVFEAIDLVHAAGGVAVWAHPFWDLTSDAEVLESLESFAEAGLDGVEAFYPTHTSQQALLLADFAAERGLLTTGSSDFHGPGRPGFDAFLAFDLYGREPVLGPIADAQEPSARSKR
jgi:predicted metal-dependent phosphoesterase TrpH